MAMSPGNTDQQTRIRTYRPGDEEAIIKVLVEVFGRWPGFDLDYQQLDHWRWRYLSEFSNTRHVCVVEVAKRIVGCLHYSKVEMKISDGVYPGTLAGDIAVLEPFRSLGLTARLAEKTFGLREKTGEQFTYFETRNERVIKQYRRIAHTLPIQSRHLIRVGRISEHLRRKHQSWSWIKGPLYKLAQSAQYIALGSIRAKTNTEATISESGALDERFDGFWEKVSQHYGLIVKRDRKFLAWRYGDSRGGRFHVLCAEDGKELLGYAVLRINKRNPAYPLGYVVDLLCLPGRESVAATLLQESLAFFDRNEVNAINCLVPRHHPYFKLYLANGFVDTLERTQVFLRLSGPLEQQLEALEELPPGRVFYAYGDIDTI